MRYLLDNDLLSGHHHASLDSYTIFKEWVIIMSSHSFWNAISVLYMLMFMLILGCIVNVLVKKGKCKESINAVKSTLWVSLFFYNLVTITIKNWANSVRYKLWLFKNVNDDIIEDVINKECVSNFSNEPIVFDFRDPTKKMLKDSKNYFRQKELRVL